MRHAAGTSVGIIILWFHLGAGAVGLLVHFGLLLWERYHKPTGKKRMSYSERLRDRFSGSSSTRREDRSKRKKPRK